MFQVQPLKMLNTFLLLILGGRITGKIFWGPVPSEKAADQSDILDLGSQNSLLLHDMGPTFFFFLNHSTLLYK